ncbi:hypothetical protein [Actinophytocola sediminis]
MARDADHGLLAVWSIAHGFATLRRTGNLDQLLAGRDPETEFATMARQLTPPH